MAELAAAEMSLHHFSGEPHIEEPRKIAGNPALLKPAGSRLRIASYNIEHFSDGVDDWVAKTPDQARRQARAAGKIIEIINPDVLLIEEIENRKALHGLNESMKTPFPLGCITEFGSDVDEKQSQNIALLSRVQLKGLREIDFDLLSGPGAPPRGFLSFFIELDNRRRLLVYGVHLKANVGEDRAVVYSKRWNAFRILRADADQIAGRFPEYHWEVLVTGDMNVDPESEDFGDDPTFQPLADWVDLWLGRSIEERTTIPTRLGDTGPRHPPQGFDRFIFSPELAREPWIASIPKIMKIGVDIQNARAVPGDGDDHVSDHYPVYMDIVSSRASGAPPGSVVPGGVPK